MERISNETQITDLLSVSERRSTTVAVPAAVYPADLSPQQFFQNNDSGVVCYRLQFFAGLYRFDEPWSCHVFCLWNVFRRIKYSLLRFHTPGGNDFWDTIYSDYVTDFWTFRT